MKDFFKFMFATVAGVIISCVVLFFLSVLIFFSAISSSDSETHVRKNSIMVLNLTGTLEERAQSNPYDALLGDDYGVSGLDDILSSIRKAKENENIKGIYLQGEGLAAGFASLEEIRNALSDFKESGKFIVSYASHYSQGMYYLSSVADKVMLNPEGSIGWYGLSATTMFRKDLLDKIGVEMQIFKVGTYKSAVEPDIATRMSDANREQVTAYVNSVWNHVTQAVADSRKLTTEQLNELADRMMMMQPARESIESGLADTLIYKNDVRDYLKTLVGIDQDDDLALLSLQDMINVKKNQPKDKSGNIIAVYYAYGAIADMPSMGSTPYIRASKVIRDLRRLQEDEDVKAVVLRVNSPGGSAFDSEQIWYAIEQLKKEKPVIVSMGDYAASGGYYISCNADTIVADATTLTGSIGIYGKLPNAEKLADKLGLDFDVVKTNTYSDMGSFYRPMNEGEKALMQANIERGYDLFLTRCAEGRGMTKEEINKIAQGRVWTGVKAKELGLVDEIGGLDRALEIAIDKADVEAYTVMSYPGKESFWEGLMNTNPGTYVKARILQSTVGQLYQQLEQLEYAGQGDYLQARMPFTLTIE